jgi:aspartyl/asparaginyl beta-hydroxylase (cupin superfamily)
MEQCWLRVEDQIKYYQEGKCFIFDDSYDHEVIHEGFFSNRVVLLIDFFHPDLTHKEKQTLKDYFPK